MRKFAYTTLLVVAAGLAPLIPLGVLDYLAKREERNARKAKAMKLNN